MEKIGRDQRLPLEWYKENVNLVEFAQEMYGFEVNYKHTPKFSSGTPNWITMENDNGENFIFSRNFQDSGNSQVSHYYYKNTTGNSHEPVFGNNRYDRGTIFDFIMFREGIELGKAIGKIKAFINEVQPKLKDQGKYDLKPSKRVSMGEGLMPHYGIHAIDNKNPDPGILTFLEIRGIPKEVLTDDKFSKHIFFRSYENHYGYTNTDLCFPITSPQEKNFVGFFSVNQYAADQASFKQILGFKNDGLWFSGFDKTKPLEAFIITESPIDALSHYYLNPHLKDKNILYASTIGSIAASQVNTIDLVIETYKPQRVHPACDKDTEGQKFNLFIASQSAQKREAFEKYQVLFHSNKHHIGEMVLNVNCKTLEENVLCSSKIKGFFDVANEKFTQKDIERKAFSVHIEKLGEDQCCVKADFYSTARNWNALAQLVIDTKLDQGNPWKIDLAVNKDFNEDLQMANLAYRAEIAEISQTSDKRNSSDLPSFNDFLKDNYRMDGSENGIFLNKSKVTKDVGPFLAQQIGNDKKEFGL